MSLKKVDWDIAPEGAEFYADGLFYKSNASNDGLYYKVECGGWAPCIATSKQTLMDFDDYEERPSIRHKIDWENQPSNIKFYADGKFWAWNEVLNLHAIDENGDIYIPKSKYEIDDLLDYEENPFYEKETKSKAPFTPLDFESACKPDDELKANMMISAVRHMRRRGYEYDSGGWYKDKEYLD